MSAEIKGMIFLVHSNQGENSAEGDDVHYPVTDVPSSLSAPSSEGSTSECSQEEE